MKNIAIVNLTGVTSWFFEKIDGKRQIDRLLDYGKSLPYIEKIILLLTEEMDVNCEKIVKDNWNEEVFARVLKSISQGFDHLFYFFGDCPLLDKNLSGAMFKDHINYYAEYTFADGYPYGLTPEIIDINILPALEILAKGSTKKVDRESLFNIIKKDINSFELETKISETDLRLLRVSLTTDSKRNFYQLSRIISSGGRDADSVTEILLKEPGILIQEPSYITIELTKNRLQNVSYLPERNIKKEFMELSDVETILQKIKDYSEDGVIAFTPEYEPVTHPDFPEIVKLITDRFGFDLYIETSGLGWSQELITEIETNSRIKVIVLLDALNRDIYKELRGDGQAEAYNFAKDIINRAKERVWVQATRMKTNENDMEPFYRYWQEYTDQIIIQKYSDYNGSLPDLKVADLSPLKRFPCWHLKRDLHINTEGDALLCFNDVKGETPLGSFLKEDIESVMERKKAHYINHINCEYKGLCRNCDEYYTFNF